MFDLVTKYKRVIQVFLGLIAITFATWGIESYTQFRASRDTVATVEGMEISQREFADELRRQQDQLRRVYGGAIDAAVLDAPESRRAVLEGLITQRLLAREVGRANMFMSREAVIEAITSAPEFQENGKFSAAKYSAYLAARGISDQGNVAELQSRLPLARFAGSISETAIAPRSVASRLAAIEAQQREVSEARISEQQFLPQVKIEEAQVKAHYDAHQADYRVPERVRAEYLVLSAEALARQDPPTEEEIKVAYEARASQFRVDEQRRASHILVKTKEEAEKLLQELKKNPGRLAELAKKHSQDPGSAEKGGDLGWFGRGMMVKPFEEAAFKLGQNEMEVVESEFGFHVLRVTGIQAAKARPYEEVRKELAEELARQKGQRKFAEAAESFSNLVYEQSESLKPAAERFKLQVQQTGWVAKSARQELGALDNPKLLSALFSSDAIKNRRNTDAIEIAPNTLVAARVLEHQPAAQRSFEEVKGQIAAELRQREASALALKDGQAKLEKLRKGEDAGVKWSAPRLVSRRDAQGITLNVLRQVVAADTSKLPAYVGVPIPDGGYALLRISKVIEEPIKEGDPQVAARFAQLYGAAQYEAMVESLRSRADIDINAANLEKK
ncbi:MAG TPA: SurA N-terminal domain-containing protein [Burkholderiales bacterium]|nr:SurA N-terminal domain-containing protein [Burkholderiales bacterium]